MLRDIVSRINELSDNKVSRIDSKVDLVNATIGGASVGNLPIEKINVLHSIYLEDMPEGRGPTGNTLVWDRFDSRVSATKILLINEEEDFV